MSLFNIHLGNPGIVTYHIQTAVPQQRLQGENVTTRTQVGNGKRMSKPVGIGFLDAGFRRNAFDQMPQGIWIEATVPANDKQRRIRIFPIFPFSQIAPEGMASGLPQIYNPPLSAFRTPILAVTDIQLSSPGFKVSHPK
jgi:hypothetical protein